MLKILLVYDDFQELTTVELMLKKIGFDVVGITSEFSLAEQLLSFNPQIVVAQGRTAKVSTANVGRRLRENVRWDGSCVLIFYANAKPQATELMKIRMDIGLEYPVEPTKLVQVMAQLGNLDSNQLLDKLIKNISNDGIAASNKETTTISGRSDKDSVYVSGGQRSAEESQKFGSTANSEEKKVLSANEAMEALINVNQKPEQTNKPLFPLSGGSQPSASTKVDSKLTNGNETNSVAGGLDPNPFKMDLKAKDPIMQELESLLQGKPDLSLHPPIVDTARHKKYEEYMKSIPIQQLASIKRTDAKRRLRDLVKDLEKPDLADQDVLRREYVKALFKKEG